MIFDEGYQARRTGPKPSPIEYEITDDNCWVCTDKYRDSFGYTVITRFGKKIYLHRYSYSIANNVELNSSIIIRHSCDNPNCFNPQHLQEGTIQDNNSDMVERNRYRVGEEHQNSLLTFEECMKIKALLEEGLSSRQVAEKTGFSIYTAQEISCGRHWSVR